MVIIARQLTVAFHNLFTTRKYKLILISLVLIAAFISVSELAVAKLFTGIILNLLSSVGQHLDYCPKHLAVHIYKLFRRDPRLYR